LQCSLGSGIASCNCNQRSALVVSAFMVPYLRRFPQYVPMVLGVTALASVGALAAWNFFPALFPPHAHDLLGAFPLGVIALAYLAHQVVVRRPERKDLAKAILLAIAFLSWAANQLWPELPQAGLFNDAAIALFVLDVFLAMISRPPSSSGSCGGEILNA
jgi:ABC-type Fe3+-siderophore transport system permease subunit